MFSLRACCRKSILTIAWSVAGVLSAPVETGAGEVVLQSNFETDPTAVGWGSTWLAGLNSWTTDDSFSPTHSLRVHDALWYSPVMPLELGRLYSVEFRGKTTGQGMWGPLHDQWSVYRGDGTWQRHGKVFRDDVGA